jgi:hypothetical protein
MPLQTCSCCSGVAAKRASRKRRPLIRTRYANFSGDYQSETEKEDAQRREAAEISDLLSSLASAIQR